MMGLGPIHAMTALLKKFQLSLTNIDHFEINEAFAAQVLACLKAWDDTTYCREQLHCEDKLGLLEQAQINSDGGAIALGHPVGASGARVVLHALKRLNRHQGQRALASLCIGGGQGGAILVERT
jgi:acetyl-CoA C-acetyltransferase